MNVGKANYLLLSACVVQVLQGGYKLWLLLMGADLTVNARVCLGLVCGFCVFMMQVCNIRVYIFVFGL